MGAASMIAAVTVEKIPYAGWPNCYRLSNGEVELIVTSDVGPRIIRYGFEGGQNLFVELEEDLGQTGGDNWRLYGGSRLWVGPEDPVYSYGADNDPVQIEISGSRLVAQAPVEHTGVQKAIAVELSDEGSAVRVVYTLANRTIWPLRVATWVLTMMAPGGAGITTLPPRGTHPEVLAPTNPLVVFAFTNMADPRWTWLEKYIVLQQDPLNADPEKIGLFNPATRGAYLLNGELFVKKFAAFPEEEYPDMGSSYETFTNERFLEIETLGPVRTLQPGESIDHVEEWSLHRPVAVDSWDDAELDRVLAPYLE
ncbi:MAG: hypothetical protein F4Y47_16980 [Acidobacteriia bacterium]|nr:hypothetical protein [Terriglobia bacterium]MYG02666.1 hypothetical protein [Terriglobia bacterium]MYK09087.1 hypothetical protein [Terriglobia bacterium]